MPFFDRLRRWVPGRPPSEPFARGTHLLERGRLDEAEAAFIEALSVASRPADVALTHNKLAIVAIRRGDRAAAIDALIVALEADPRSPAPITTLGNLLLEDGAIDDALVHYDYAILIDDNYAPAYHNRGVALHRSGKRAEAVRNLRKATRLEARIRRSG